MPTAKLGALDIDITPALPNLQDVQLAALREQVVAMAQAAWRYRSPQNRIDIKNLAMEFRDIAKRVLSASELLIELADDDIWDEFLTHKVIADVRGSLLPLPLADQIREALDGPEPDPKLGLVTLYEVADWLGIDYDRTGPETEAA
jgi:hypothetical protein